MSDINFCEPIAKNSAHASHMEEYLLKLFFTLQPNKKLIEQEKLTDRQLADVRLQ